MKQLVTKLQNKKGFLTVWPVVITAIVIATTIAVLFIMRYYGYIQF